MSYDRTDLEQIVFDLLKSKGIDFVEQYPTSSGFVLDFVVGPDICIEADGPCHDSSKAKKRDWFRTKCLKLEGWKVYRLGYELINDPERLSARITEILLK
jgi:very-short-patch-repair endonuclease